jgi:chemotaxis protein methyltransferase CheR
MEMNRASLSIFSALLEARTGQRFDQDRHRRIGYALAPIMRAHGIAGCDRLAMEIAGGQGRQLSDEIVDALLNNETYFFRDQRAFAQVPEVLESIAADRQDSKRLRIWSAGCSTGQELLSVAMQIAENEARWQGWKVELLGTDVSQSAVSRAQAADYGQFEIQRGLSARRLLRWFHKVR